MTKRELRNEMRDFASAFMFEFLRQEIGLVPSLSTDVRKLVLSSNILDFFSAEELKREFLIYSALDEGVFEEVGLEFPHDFMIDILAGSEDGLRRWMRENIEKLCRDFGVSRVWIVGAKEPQWAVVVEDEGLSKEEVIEWLEGEGLKVDLTRMYLFRFGDRKDWDDDRWQDLLDVLTKWGTSGVEIYEYGEVEEWMTLRIRDLVKELYEAIAISALYAGAEEYKRKQPGQVDRVEQGALLVGNIEEMRFLPFWGTRELRIDAKIWSESERKQYQATVVVQGMDFSEEFDEWTPVKVVDGKTGEEFYMRLIEVDDLVRVRCGCADFKNRFVPILKQRRAVQGPVALPRRTTDRKSQNVARVATVCKHLFAVFEALMRAGVLVSTAHPLRREIDLTKGIEV